MSGVILVVSDLVLFNLTIILLGITFILFSIGLLRQYSRILDLNDYSTKQWRLVAVLMLFFAIAYTLHLIQVSGSIEIPIDNNTLVSLVYFGGAVFVIITIQTTKDMIEAILGGNMTDEVAYEMFIEKIGSDTNLPHLYDDFEILCEFCKIKVNYSIADVVRSHANVLDRGFSVMSTFGVRSFILRPSHKCANGRREITVVHDDSLAFRSIDNSRIVVGDNL